MSGNSLDTQAALQRAGQYFQSGRFGEALRLLGGLLESAPSSPGLRLNRAHVLSALSRYQDAAADYRAVLDADPAIPFVLGNYLRCKTQACDWDGLEESWERALRAMRDGKPAISPFIATALARAPIDQLHAARILTALRCPPQAPLWKGERYRHGRIRIAYVSADFHAHATATLMAGLFERQDRAAFETIAVSYGPDDGSPMRRRLEKAFDRFLSVPEKSPRDIALLMRGLEIDIALDLKGHTSSARPEIFAHRPAPVAVNYLGFPCTMGAPYIDYLVADRVVIPDADREFYDEKIVTLPCCYQPNDADRMQPSSSLSRADAGLPQAGTVFCCFNNPFKITPDIFALWLDLLRQTEGSVLWLLDDNPDATRNLKAAAANAGIAPERLVFAPPLSNREHLARHALADLFLDTLPYNAHTTASDALWMGLPVLTQMGGTFAGRVAASLLTACGLPELIARSPDEYRALALKLAREPAALTALKMKVARTRKTALLFDTAATTRALEAAFRTMWERSQGGLPPESFSVPPAI